MSGSLSAATGTAWRSSCPTRSACSGRRYTSRRVPPLAVDTPGANELMLCAAPHALAAPGVGAVFAHLPAEGVAGVPYAVPGAWHARGELHNRFACTYLNSASLPRCGPTQMGFMMSMTNAIGFYKSSKGTNAQDAVPLLVSSPEADTLSTLPQRQGPRSAPGCQDSLPSMCAAACSDDTMRSAPTCQSNPVSHSGCLSVSSRNPKARLHMCAMLPR